MQQRQKNAPRQRSTERGARHAARELHSTPNYNTVRPAAPRRDFVMPDEEKRNKRKLRVLDVITVIVLVAAVFTCIWGGAMMYQRGYEAGYHYATEVEQR